MALDSFERIKNVKILKVLPENIVLLSRGLEDGLARNDHIKLVHGTEGYSARALCLKSLPSESYWRLYRIPHSEKISMDYSYTIIGMADKEIPYPEIKIRDIEQKIIDESTTPPADIKQDLPVLIQSAVK